MTKIVVSLGDNMSIENHVLIAFQKITSLGLGQIKNSISSGVPIVEYDIFGSEHQDNADRLRKLVSLGRDNNITLKFYEMGDHESYESLENSEVFEIADSTLINILDEFENELERQMSM
jgi:hypothetical protein